VKLAIEGPGKDFGKSIVTVVRFFDANNTGINSKGLYLIVYKTLSIQIIYISSNPR
jgi:hypothetical protein